MLSPGTPLRVLPSLSLNNNPYTYRTKFTGFLLLRPLRLGCSRTYKSSLKDQRDTYFSFSVEEELHRGNIGLRSRVSRVLLKNRENLGPVLKRVRYNMVKSICLLIMKSKCIVERRFLETSVIK